VGDDPLAVLKEGVKIVWSLGDYREIAAVLAPEADSLAAWCGVGPGRQVLDVAAGTGNLAVAAARLGARVAASDLTPQMVAWGRERAAAEGLAIAWGEADAEDLPDPDERYDVVASMFGAMFAPRPARVVEELFRVTKPGGTVAMANWAPDGFSGRLSELIAGAAPPFPVALPSPMRWGDADEVRARFADRTADVDCERRAARFAFGSIEEAFGFFASYTGGIVALRATATPQRFEAFTDAMRALVADSCEPREGKVVLDNAYLAVRARKPVPWPAPRPGSEAGS